MTLNFIGFYHYLDMVFATGLGIIIGLAIGYSVARGDRKK